MNGQTFGIAAMLAGGALNGGFTFPMKSVKHWRWENMWLVFGFFGLLFLPSAIALLAVPHLFSVYAAVPGRTLLWALSLGLSWGVGSLLFGLGISALGLSLGYAVIMGTTAIFGTLVPALALDSAIFQSVRGWELLASLGLIVAGIALCGVAGTKRESAAAGSGSSYRMLLKIGFRRGLFISLLAGVLSACFNIGFAVTAEISKKAEQFGAAPGLAVFSVWALIMGAGFLPSLVYCVYLAARNQSFSAFRTAHSNWLRALLMAALWILSVALYGAGATSMGARGAAIGWPILMSITIFTANGIGILSGEWKGLERRVVGYLYSGLTLLLLAVVLAGLAGVH